MDNELEQEELAELEIGDKIRAEKDKPKPHPHRELDNLFEVPQPEDNDMYIDDLFEVESQDVDLEDDLSDLTQVSNEDIMGRKPRPKPVKYRRTGRAYTPPTSLGGMR